MAPPVRRHLSFCDPLGHHVTIDAEIGCNLINREPSVVRRLLFSNPFYNFRISITQAYSGQARSKGQIQKELPFHTM